MRKELLPGEQVIAVTRPQPRRLILPAALFVLVPALAAFASAWIVRGGPARLVPWITRAWEPWLLTACVAVAAWILLTLSLPRYLAWRATRYTLTSHRLIARYGMLRRRDEQVFLAGIRHVVVHQTLIQRVLRSGNISLEAGNDSRTVISDVPEVATFRMFILDAVEDLATSGGPGNGAMFPHRNDARTWEMREGGTDER